EQMVAGAAGDYNLFFAGTDGWFYMPPSPNLGVYHPDPLAPAPFTTYIFGFRNVTAMTDEQRQNQRNKAQHNAPFFWVDEGTEFKVQLTNLGLQLRPDLTDAHSLHWHGFRNVIPFFDGEPTGSISVPVNQLFTYVYRPHDPGTYMYHCHVEDIEHVTMGMTSIVFVRPAMGPNFAYNDASTQFDRQFPMFLSEIWAKGHWNDAHIQESIWGEFKADFSLLNGRVYPDTLLPNSPIDLTATASSNALSIQHDANGDLMTNPGYEHLQYNPHSALVTCKEGERVLLRFANLGFREAAMTLAGIKMRVVGRDATPMKGRDGTDTSYETDTLLMGAGESFDVIFTAPAFDATQAPNGYNTYVLYNRRYTQENSLAGQRTEVRVYSSGSSLGAQAYFNQHPDDLAS
ncbi:MAG TPA: multicopper oxidase domain-containing protein, partial [Anaerolineales bacterium]